MLGLPLLGDAFSWLDTVFSDGGRDFVSPQNPALGTEVTIRLRMTKDHPSIVIFLRTAPEGEQAFQPMSPDVQDDFFSYFSIRLKLYYRILHYRFLIIAGGVEFWFNGDGILDYTPPDLYDLSIITDFDDPTWVKKSVFYQIFPDRFFDGNSETNVKTGEYSVGGHPTRALKWREVAPTEADANNYPFLDFYGGDLEGIRKKIPYLESLGVNALYLTPIFHSPSNHKYDVIDYKRIDPHIGNNDEFTRLVKELHSAKIHIILDGVFNHTGEGHHWINRLGLFKDGGAYGNLDSPHRDYYFFEEGSATKYYGWLGHSSLPVLNYQSEGVRKEIYGDKDSAMKFWLNTPFDTDGWRLDVANMLAKHPEPGFAKRIWREIRKAVKETKSDAYLLGEHFFDASDLLDGESLDAAMNYHGFYIPLIKWLTGFVRIRYQDNGKGLWWQGNVSFTAEMFHKHIHEYRSLLPFQIQLLNYNLLGSHDVPRFQTLVANDFQKVKIGVSILFTFIGVPSVYYGDEVGMDGGGDPDNRRPMVWEEDKQDNRILNLYRRLITLRKTSIELQTGSFLVLLANRSTYAFARFSNTYSTIVVLHATSGVQDVAVPAWKLGMVDATVREVIEGKNYKIIDGHLSISLTGFDAMIFQTLR